VRLRSVFRACSTVPASLDRVHLCQLPVPFSHRRLPYVVSRLNPSLATRMLISGTSPLTLQTWHTSSLSPAHIALSSASRQSGQDGIRDSTCASGSIRVAWAGSDSRYVCSPSVVVGGTSELTSACKSSQSHPFTVASSPGGDEGVRAVIKVAGDWTRKVYELAAGGDHGYWAAVDGGMNGRDGQ
jgi:hypothetical protein